ncbi:hypothetical protein HanRHA438_Chr13g0609911 [Helianthus annuus]|nr:hypothetical protein HanIR_Chr13g0651941 [Helianthus annuus]KAJ0859217.1 hypothetical protein HanRHA438_Chr13g0609911 [Helianthus annuus]
MLNRACWLRCVDAQTIDRNVKHNAAIKRKKLEAKRSTKYARCDVLTRKI